jgi:hypothetical protein
MKKAGMYLRLCFILLFIGLFFLNSCQREKKLSDTPHFVIDNNNIKEKQDLSDFFSVKTIIVNEQDAHLIPGMVRTFEYLDGTLILVSRFPKGVISAIDDLGNLKWQLQAEENPLTSFSSLSGFFLDRKNEIIKIFDDDKHRIYSYNLNGEFINVSDGPKFSLSDVYLTEREDLLYSLPAYENGLENDDGYAALIKLDNDDFELDLVLSRHNIRKLTRPYLDYNNFFEDNKQDVFFHKDFNDTVYNLQNSLLKPELTFSFAKNDRRSLVQNDPNIYQSSLVQYFLDENIPYSMYVLPLSDYVICSYVYNFKEIFAMVDKRTNIMLVNSQKFVCDGVSFAGKLDYNRGVLLNQMHFGNYKQINDLKYNEQNEHQDETLVYNLLFF